MTPDGMTQEAAMDGNRFDDATKALIGRVSTRRAALTAAALATGAALRDLAAPPTVRARRRTLKPAFRCSGTRNDGQSAVCARYGQVFTASRSGTLRKIQILIWKAPDSVGDYVIQLVKVVNGVPSESPLAVLAAVTIPNGSVPNEWSMLTGNFVGTRLEQGTEYAAVVSRPEGTDIAVGMIRGTGDACTGTFARASCSTTFLVESDRDVIASVFVA